MEGVCIADGVDALTYGELVEFVLTGDLVRAAHLVGELLPLVELLEFFIPAHASVLS